MKVNSHYSRVLLVAIDQSVSSVSNFIIIWLCLTSLPTNEFGQFSYIWTVIALFIVMSRAIFGVPALLDGDSSQESPRTRLSASVTGTFFLGLISCVVSLFLYFFFDGFENSDYWLLGLIMLTPLILIQDQIRYLAIALNQIKLTIVLDTLLLAFVLAITSYMILLEFSGFSFILYLAVSYLVVIGIFARINPIKINYRATKLSISSDFRRRYKLTLDAIIVSTFGLLGISLIRIGAGDDGVGVYNGLVFLFGPVSILTVFITLGLQTEANRTKGYLAFRHKAALVLISSIPIIWLLIINSIPDSYLNNFLGDSTQDILRNAAPFGLAAALGIGLEVLNLFMRANQKFSAIVNIRLSIGLVSIGLIMLSIYLSLELMEIIYALAVANAIGILLSAIELRKRVSQVDV